MSEYVNRTTSWFSKAKLGSGLNDTLTCVKIRVEKHRKIDGESMKKSLI